MSAAASAETKGWEEITLPGADVSAYIGTNKTEQLMGRNIAMFYMRMEYKDPQAVGGYRSAVMRYAGDCDDGSYQRTFYATFQKNGLYGKPVNVSHHLGDVMPMNVGSVMEIAVSTACTLSGIEPQWIEPADPVIDEPTNDGDVDMILQQIIVTGVGSEGKGK